MLRRGGDIYKRCTNSVCELLVFHPEPSLLRNLYLSLLYNQCELINVLLRQRRVQPYRFRGASLLYHIVLRCIIESRIAFTISDILCTLVFLIPASPNVNHVPGKLAFSRSWLYYSGGSFLSGTHYSHTVGICSTR